MITSNATNKRTQVRFSEQEDTTIRSAWKTSNRSLKPPSPAERKETLGMDTLEKAKLDAALVASLDGGSNHNCDGTTPIPKPSSILKHRSEPIPKTIHPLMATRSAWDSNCSLQSRTGPNPVQRQLTLEESDLRDACASIAAMAFSNPRDSSLRDGLSMDFSIPEKLSNDSGDGDSRW